MKTLKITISDAKFIKANATSITLDKFNNPTYHLDVFYRMINVSINYHTITGRFTDLGKPRDYVSYGDVEFSKTAGKILSF